MPPGASRGLLKVALEEAATIPLPLRKVAVGLAAGVRARRGVFSWIAGGVLVLNLVLPVVVLSLARRPVDFFTFNPWLSRLPEYLASTEYSLGRKLSFLSRMAIAWFSADSPVEGIEWGYVIDVPSLAWMLGTSLLVASYVVVWLRLRDLRGACATPGLAAPRAGVAGGLTGLLGVSTGPCSVAGCGVPVLPVVGLAVTGVSSDTLRLLAGFSRVAVVVVLLALALGTLWLAWIAGDRPAERAGPGVRNGGPPIAPTAAGAAPPPRLRSRS